jgi:hypothetical protein
MSAAGAIDQLPRVDCRASPDLVERRLNPHRAAVHQY